MPIKFVPTYVTEDGKTYDTVDKAISHERRRLVQHLLLDQREKLHLTLADIDKAAAVICAVQGQVAGVFDEDLSPDLSALKRIVDPVGETYSGKKIDVTVTQEETGKSVRVDIDPKIFDRAQRFPDGGIVGRRTEIPPMVHSDIRTDNGYRAADALGAALVPGDLVRLVAGASAADLDAWGVGGAQYQEIKAVANDDQVRIGELIWSSRALIRKAGA